MARTSALIDRVIHLALVITILGAGALLPSTADAAEAVGPPTLVSPAESFVAHRADVRVTPGSSTTSMTVLLNGAPVGSLACTTGVTLSFGRVAVPAGRSTLTVVSSDPLGGTRTFDYALRRVEYSWPTCIIIDKSDFRLYWIRDDVLVKSYAIAHGKRRTPTPAALWIVGRKERTPPRSVYGPRKLRLFRRVYAGRRRGYRYKYTRYAVHGTNQPWVIGTLASHGCIRLTNASILDLWPRVPAGTIVQTRQ
ncbi:MAG: L,D-transpeptidase [Coriobacteriia bacterium]|nr:L,D-transpeptidase [Coriobacteriia bacterium]